MRPKSEVKPDVGMKRIVKAVTPIQTTTIWPSLFHGMKTCEYISC